MTDSFTWNAGNGALFPNHKEKESQPDYRGNMTCLCGRRHEIAGWKKDGQKGKYLSLKFQEPRDQHEQSEREEPPTRHKPSGTPF